MKRDPLALPTYLVLLLGAAVTIFPFLWMVATAFKAGTDVYALTLLPPEPTLANFRKVLFDTKFVYWFENSLIVAGTVMVSVAFFDSLAGYVLAKIRFPGRDLLMVIFLSSIMIPTEMLVIPWYIMSARLGWINTFWGAMFPGVITAFGIFLMRQFFQSVPDDLLDAARIDGMGEFGIWWRVALPQVRPALAALLILTFLGNWNAFLWPVIVLDHPVMLTLPVGLSFFSNEMGAQWELIMAASSLAVLPVLLVFMIFQRQIIQGITLTGFK